MASKTTPLVQPKGCTNFKIRQLARLLSRHYDAELGKVGLKTTQYALLKRVLTYGPLAPGELAHLMGLEPSTLTRNLQPLIAAGWLLQVAGSNARSRQVEITEAGRAKIEEALAYWKVAQLAINTRLGVERVAALHTLIDDCVDELNHEEVMLDIT